MPTTKDDSDKAVAHALKVRDQLQKDEAFPIQTLKGRNLPTDAKVDKDYLKKLDNPPAGFEEWIDVYEGPRGIGYVVNLEVVRAGIPYRKQLNFGGEPEREQDWTEVVEPTGPPGPSGRVR